VFIRKERQARWERLHVLKKVNGKCDTIFNAEFTGGYHKFLQKPSLPRQSHVDHYHQGIKETQDLISQADKEKENTQTLLRKCYVSLKPKIHINEQIKHYQDHLSQLRILKEKLIHNLQKLEGTLQGLRKIFTVTKRNIDKSGQS